MTTDPVKALQALEISYGMQKCDSTNIVKNGRTPAGQQKYHGRVCGIYTVTDDRAQERAAKMNLGEKLHHERVSQRGIARVTGASRPTIIRWLRKKVLRPIGATILPTLTRPEIEIDEPWSYVGNKGQVVWHWVAVERGTKRVVGGPSGLALPRPAARCGNRCLPIIASVAFLYRRVLCLSTGAACVAAPSASERARRDQPGGPCAQHVSPVVRQSGGGKRCRSVGMCICMRCASASSLMPTTRSVQAFGGISTHVTTTDLQIIVIEILVLSLR
jgi:transposase-like protein